jgi:hypothetical protein
VWPEELRKRKAEVMQQFDRHEHMDNTYLLKEMFTLHSHQAPTPTYNKAEW